MKDFWMSPDIDTDILAKALKGYEQNTIDNILSYLPKRKQTMFTPIGEPMSKSDIEEAQLGVLSIAKTMSKNKEINLSDISNLDNDLNKNLKSPKEMRDKVFSGGFIAPPPTPEISATDNLKVEPIKLKLNEPGESKLGENSTNLEGKDNTWDGMKKFNNIPVDPNLNVPEKPKMTNEQLLKEKVKQRIFLRKLE